MFEKLIFCIFIIKKALTSIIMGVEPLLTKKKIYFITTLDLIVLAIGGIVEGGNTTISERLSLITAHNQTLVSQKLHFSRLSALVKSGSVH